MKINIYFTSKFNHFLPPPPPPLGEEGANSTSGGWGHPPDNFLGGKPPPRSFDFWSPAGGDIGDLRIHSRSFLRTRSQNPFICLFCFFAQCCSIISVRKWHFRFLTKKSRFRHFGPKLTKNGHFGPKTVILTSFSKSFHRISLILHIETKFMVYYYNYPVKVLTKIFFALFWPKLVHFDPEIDIWANFSQSAHRILLILNIETTFMVYY